MGGTGRERVILGGRELGREGEKTRQSKVKASAFDNLTLEETHPHFCGILVVKSDQPCYSVGGVNIRRCGSWGDILETDCTTLHQWINFF